MSKSNPVHNFTGQWRTASADVSSWGQIQCTLQAAHSGQCPLSVDPMRLSRGLADGFIPAKYIFGRATIRPISYLGIEQSGDPPKITNHLT